LVVANAIEAAGGEHIARIDGAGRSEASFGHNAPLQRTAPLRAGAFAQHRASALRPDIEGRQFDRPRIHPRIAQIEQRLHESHRARRGRPDHALRPRLDRVLLLALHSLPIRAQPHVAIAKVDPTSVRVVTAGTDALHELLGRIRRVPDDHQVVAAARRTARELVDKHEVAHGRMAVQGGFHAAGRHPVVVAKPPAKAEERDDGDDGHEHGIAQQRQGIGRPARHRHAA
jgi:hypothetical protein